VELRKTLSRNRGITLVEVMVAGFILALVLGPVLFLLSKNLNHVREVRGASVALNLAKEGMEKVRSSGFILGSFYVTGAGEGSFVDGSTAPCPRALKVRMEQMGSEEISLSINSGAATGTIPANSPAGAIIDLVGSELSDVTGVSISGGSASDCFYILYFYSDSIRTVDETSWRTQYTFAPNTAPLEVRVNVFKESLTEAMVELVTLVETLPWV